MPPKKSNTAKKSCGGSARKLLAPAGSPPTPAGSTSSAPSLEPEDARIPEEHSILTDWSKCIEVPEAHIDAVRHPDVIFLCLSCHSLRMVKEPAPYFGFYRNILPEEGGTPVLPGFLQFNGKYELASNSILAATPLAIVHFALGAKYTISTPVPLLSHYLDKYYPNGGFLYVEISFDVATYTKIDKYTCDQVETVAKLVRHLGSTGRVFAFLSNHSEEDSGWLYAGKEGRGEGEYVAMEVQHVLSTVLKPYARILKSAHIVFLVCGSVVAYKTPYTQLKESVLQFNFASAILFSTARFQPLVAMAELVAIEQLSIHTVFPTLLSMSGGLGQHTSVILMTPVNIDGCCKLELTTFARAHTQTSPWGVPIPAQCPQCGSTKSWGERVAVTVSDENRDAHASAQGSVCQYIYTCKYTNCGSTQKLPCYKFSVTKPPGSIINTARTKNCAWFKSPSTHFVSQSLPDSTQGKRKNETASPGTAKKARKQDSEDLPKGLKKAIRRYYLQFLTDTDDRRAEQEVLGDEPEEEPSGVSPEDRELAARPKDAGFYKKELNAWDVAQKLFKQEMDDYDKEQQQKKGMQHSIKYRTGHAREWFNNMTSAHQKEVEEARDKWNREGAPAEAQAMYRKKSLKKVLDDFTEQIRRSMGCRVVMLVSHKKNADQTLSVKIHESQPVNHKKPFSLSSRGSKEWTSEGFEKFAEWSKEEFYPTNDDDDSSDEDSKDGKDAIPEVILDEHGFAKLPSRKGVGLKGRQELVRQIFHASYKVFTGSKKPVPWLSIAGNLLVYLDPDSIPEGFVVQDPSHLKAQEINHLWGHWETRKASKQKLVIFVGAVSSHMNKSLLVNAVYVGEKQSKKKYVPVDTDDEEEASAAPTSTKRTRQLAEAKASSKPKASTRPTKNSRPQTQDSSEDSSDDNLTPSKGLVKRPSVGQEVVRTPATVPKKDRMSFLRSLSSQDEYLLLISRLGDLKKEQSSEAMEWPAWATWSWDRSHLPNSVHSDERELNKFLEIVVSAKISGLVSAMGVSLGLGMLLRECKRVIEYEEDEATPNTPSYLGTSILSIKTHDLVIEAINTARGGVTRMLKAKEGQHAAIAEAAAGEEHGADTAIQTISTREEKEDEGTEMEADELTRKLDKESWEVEEEKKKMAMLQEDMRKLEERKRELEEYNQKLLKLVEIEKDSGGKDDMEDKEQRGEEEKAEEEEEEEEEVVVQKGKKRGKSGGSGRPSKKATTDNIRRSSRSRKPSKKAMRK
ncbi:hypothetical protein F4604DRAFT_1683705 [Suillus subluteus]|nr:hypothetical protein F4604DRAFT_1683705 [Suillus subluteus]